MTKKEKILATLLTFSMLSIIISAIYTIHKNQPTGYKFNYQRLVEKITN